jgi:hypothetical protein
MSKFVKGIYVAAVFLNIAAGVTSLFCQNWVLGINQLSLAWFMFLYYKNNM